MQTMTLMVARRKGHGPPGVKNMLDISPGSVATRVKCGEIFAAESYGKVISIWRQA